MVEGTGEMCLGGERQTLGAGQMVYIPPGVFHQFTNIGSTPPRMIYFDAQTTGRRAAAVKKAAALGKHVYCEKPTAVSTESALDLYRTAKAAGVKNGVVQDKLWLPGMLKIKRLQEHGFFGKILSVRGEFGYWVFEGHKVPEQEPYDNAFKVQWEMFLRHAALDEPFPWTLLQGAKGVQLAELGLESWAKRSWVDVPALEARALPLSHDEDLDFAGNSQGMDWRR